jgi:hypothetical protein
VLLQTVLQTGLQSATSASLVGMGTDVRVEAANQTASPWTACSRLPRLACDRLEYRYSLSSRLDKSWSVLVSHQTIEGNRCVDIFSRPNGSFGFEEFRKDPEDLGAWTPVSYFSGHEYPSEGDATIAACQAVPWLGPVLDR